MTARLIPHVKVDGQPAYQVSCKCGNVGTVLNPTMKSSGHIPPATLVRRFERMGWDIGVRTKDDTCPGCLAARHKRKTIPQDIPVEAPMSDTVVPLKADAPREMTREERRIVLSKLEAVYLDERRGYEIGWSDERVARDLGIPRAWVTMLRDQNFGPAVPEADPRVKELETELEATRAALKRAENHVKLYETFFEKMKQPAAELNAAVEASLASAAKAVAGAIAARKRA